MNSYVYMNRITSSEIIENIKHLFDLDILEDDDCTWLGNDNLLITVERDITRILLYDLSINIKILKKIIMGQN